MLVQVQRLLNFCYLGLIDPWGIKKPKVDLMYFRSMKTLFCPIASYRIRTDLYRCWMLFVVRLARPIRGAGIRALQTDEERRRFRSKSRNYPPQSPPGSRNPDLEEELPLLRGTSRRDPNMEADVGFPPSRDDFSIRDEEDYEEEDT